MKNVRAGSAVRVLHVLLPVFLLISLLCGPASAVGDTLVIAQTGDAKSFDPHQMPDNVSCHAMAQVYENLITANDAGEIVPQLAEKYEQIDELSYKFYLRKGVRFHNGEELKAGDVKFTFDRATSPVGKPLHMVVARIDAAKTEIVDDYTIIIRSKTPDASFLAAMTHMGGCAILNEKAVGAAGADYGNNPVGTGPYRLEKWARGDRITLTRFDGYWGEKPAIKNVVLRVVGEQTNRMIELETGGVDIAYTIPPIDLPRFDGNSKLKLVRTPNQMTLYLGLNLRMKPLDDLRVRQALTMAVNRDAIVKAVFRGIGTPARGPIAAGIKYFDNSLPPYEYNVAKAAELLAEAGYPKGFKATMIVNDAKERVDVATVLQSMFKEIGVEIDIQVMEWGAFLDQVDLKQHAMFVFGWNAAAIPDPDYSLYNPFHSSEITEGPGGRNRACFANSEVDALLVKGRLVPDGPEREGIYHQIQQKIREQSPWIFIQNGELLIGTRSYVKGFAPKANSYHRLAGVYFEE